MNKISVIIPVFNTGKYIERCLNSLKNQTYKNIEICIVNDGSTDNSDQIIRNFINNNLNMDILYTINDINKGSAGARLRALELATGEYIHMLDSDDYIETHTYKNAILKMLEKKCDTCIWGWKELNEENKVIFEYEDKYNYFDGILSGYEVCKRKMIQWLWICTGNALFSTEAIKKSAPVFIEGLDIGEDFYFICKTLINSTGVCCLRQQNFIYINRRGSLMHNTFSDKNLQIFPLFSCLNQAIEENAILKPQEKNEIESILKVEIRRSFIMSVNAICNEFHKKSTHGILSEIHKIEYKHTGLNKKYYNLIVNRKYRVGYCIFHRSPFLYCFLYKWFWNKY